MSWWNPTTWFETDAERTVRELAEANYESYLRWTADYEAGRVTESQYREFLDVYLEGTGQIIPESKEAAGRLVTGELDREKDALAWNALSNPFAAVSDKHPDAAAILPSWAKLAAAAGAALLAIHVLTKAGILGKTK